MGLPPINNNSIINRCLNYATLEPNWDVVERYLLAHPEEASICDLAPPAANNSGNNNDMIAGFFPNNHNNHGGTGVQSSSSSSCIRFSPLYIALRNELRPVPPYVVKLLLQLSFTNTMNNINVNNHNDNGNDNRNSNINDIILNNDTILMSMRNPKTTSQIMNALLHTRPTFPKMKYHWYRTPL